MSIKSILVALFSVIVLSAAPFMLLFGPDGVLLLFGIHGEVVKPENVRVGYNWNAFIALVTLLWGAWLATGAIAEEPALKKPVCAFVAVGWVVVLFLSKYVFSNLP